jgi:hypothetical protein
MSKRVKSSSEKRLHALGVRVNPHLPLLEEKANLSPRSASAVCARAFVLSFVIGVGYGRSGSEMLDGIRQADLADHLSPAENKFLGQTRYTKQNRAGAAWLAEAVQACAWALGYLPLHPLEGASDDLASLFLDVDAQQRISVAQLRPFPELYAEADFHYRLHWAARQAGLDGTEFPLPEIAVEMRRRALDWIIGVPEEWDDISTDT